MPFCTSCRQRNPDGFRFCGACGAALPVAAAAEQRKTVTLLFSDLSGSTALGERLDPESIRRVMNRYFAEMQAVLERHGGTVEKFVGDAVMAAFGIPELHEDDALRAVRAAAEMRDAQELLNEEFEPRYGARLQVRTGINTGEVVAGDPAQGQAFASGDAVNLAARLEQAAAPGEILIGDTTYRLVKDAVELEPVKPLVLKGKAEPVPAWRLLAVQDAPGFTRPISAAPFVGRRAELALLEQALGRAIEGRTCQLYTIVGPPGIGKSRLVRELVQSLGEQAQLLVGRCLSYGEGITYWPLAEIVKQLAGEQPEGWIQKRLSGEENAAVIARRIAAAIGAAEASGQAEETAWAFRKLFEALARERPLLLVIDDIHWAEPTLLDLLEYLLSFASDAPILILCPARAELFEHRPGWGAPRQNASLLTLQPLTAAEAEQLVSARALSDDHRARIVAAAEGNPLFVEQLLALQAENGADGRLDVPPTLQALLAARIDRLEADERAVIERASVEGRHFHRGAVAELLPAQARGGVGAQLLALIRKEFVRPDRALFPGDDGFRFGHILIRDAAYAAMPKQLRAELHERFADWLGRAAGERVSEYEEILGYHLEQAYRYQEELGQVDQVSEELGERASERLAASGRRAYARDDAAAAISLLERAASLLPVASATRSDLLQTLSRALADSGEPIRAAAALADAIETARSCADPRAEWRARLARCWLTYFSDPERWSREGRHDVERGVRVLEELGDDRGLAEAFILRALVARDEGHLAAAEAALTQAVEHAEPGASERVVARFTVNRMTLAVDGPRPVPEAIRLGEEAVDRLELRPAYQARARASLASLYAMRGSFEQARELVRASRATLEELGQTFWLAGYADGYGGVELLAGCPAAAEVLLRESCETLEQKGERGALSRMLAKLAEAVCRQDRHEEARRLTERSEELAATDVIDTQILLRVARAKALAHLGQPAQAEGAAREAIAFADATEYLPLRGDAWMRLAEVLSIGGRPSEAAGAATEALRLHEQKGNVVAAAEARSLLETTSASLAN